MKVTRARRARLPLRLLLATIATLSLASVARADTLVVDFESGPAVGTAINDDYLVSAFTRFLLADLGFRPQRKTVPANLAHSGTTVANVGPDLCGPSEGFQGADCEFVNGGTAGRLTRTASSITLYAGIFPGQFGTATATLRGYRANNTIAATSAATALALGFNTPVTVTSAAGDIARFELVFGGPTGIPVGFDDLTLDYPAGTLPDLSLGGPLNQTTVLQGGATDVPLSMSRINGSNGPVQMSVAGLPSGVTAEFVPNPVPGIQDNPILRLTAAPDAAPFFVPVTVTVTADPLANAAVAPAPRTLGVGIAVRSRFDLSRPSTGAVLLPQCAPVDVPLRIQRDFSFVNAAAIGLEAVGLPTGVTAEFLPGPVIAPGGGLVVEPTLRLRRGTGSIPAGTMIQVRATSAGAPTRSLAVPLGVAASTASVDASTTSGAPPSRLRDGTLVRLTGNGFCAGTKVRVGNALAEVDGVPSPESTGLTFKVARLATSGTVTVVPPAGASTYVAGGSFVVRSTRNQNGFQFDNPSYENLSLGELADLVGPEEMFVQINPCWPFSCPILALGIPDPIAFLKWQIIDQAMQSSGGHCFGINRAIQEFGAGRKRPRDFTSGVTTAFGLPSATGPSGSLESYLDARHAGQTTAEFLRSYGLRNDSISAQLNRIRAELDAGRLPGVTIRNSFTEGHVVTAHDVERLPDGSTIIHTYDNERPFLPSEDADTSGATHRDREQGSQIRVNAQANRWDYSGWSGGNDGSLYAIKLTDFPTNPSLPGIGDAVVGIFGSSGGAAVTRQALADTEVVPVFDRGAIPGAAGFLIGRRGATSIGRIVVGRRDGSYSQLITGGGFAGSVSDVQTSKGVVDRLTGDPKAGSINFSGERDRPLTIALGRGQRAATIATRTFAGGKETATFGSGSRLTYEHDGPTTTFSFELVGVESGVGAARFASGPLVVRRGDRVSVSPTDWRTLSSARVTVRSVNGRVATRTLQSRATGPRTQVTLSQPRVRVVKGRTVGEVTARLRRLDPGAAQGVVLRLSQNGRLLTKRTFAVRRATAGGRTFRLPLRKLAPGAYQLTADVTVVAGSGRIGSRRASRVSTVQVK